MLLLQGHYAFFLFDNHEKVALAARDPSGEQELWHCIEADTGAISFTNTLEQLPRGEDQGKWREVPPGHYVSGVKPMLHQFALTPAQLEARERNESTDLGFIDGSDAESERGELFERVSLSSIPNLLQRLSLKKVLRAS